MGKKAGKILTLIAVLGAITSYVGHMANKNKFSSDTKKKYNSFLHRFKSIGDDVKRTYTSIGNESDFESNAKDLTENAKSAVFEAGNLIKSVSVDMFKYAKNNIEKAIGTIDKSSSIKKTNNKTVKTKKKAQSKSKK